MPGRGELVDCPWVSSSIRHVFTERMDSVAQRILPTLDEGPLMPRSASKWVRSLQQAACRGRRLRDRSEGFGFPPARLSVRVSPKIIWIVRELLNSNDRGPDARPSRRNLRVLVLCNKDILVLESRQRGTRMFTFVYVYLCISTIANAKLTACRQKCRRTRPRWCVYRCG